MTGIFIRLGVGCVKRHFTAPVLGVVHRVIDLEFIQNLVVRVARKSLDDLTLSGQRRSIPRRLLRM